MTEQTIFLAALDIADPAERAAYLGKACAGDAALRQQVEALLVAHERPGAFLDVPACEQVAACPPPPDPGTVAVEANAEGAAMVAERGDRHDSGETQGEPRGDDEENALDFLEPPTRPGALGRLGHYEVLEVLGKGGFGIVLKAFDEMLHRVVAIKVLAPRMASTSPARERFLREARAAAAHPPRKRRGYPRRRGAADPLPGHGVHRGGDLATKARSRRAARGAGGAADRASGFPRAGGGARHGAVSPRHQAQQHPARRRSRAAGQDHRLWS